MWIFRRRRLLEHDDTGLLSRMRAMYVRREPSPISLKNRLVVLLVCCRTRRARLPRPRCCSAPVRWVYILSIYVVYINARMFKSVCGCECVSKQHTTTIMTMTTTTNAFQRPSLWLLRRQGDAPARSLSFAHISIDRHWRASRCHSFLYIHNLRARAWIIFFFFNHLLSILFIRGGICDLWLNWILRRFFWFYFIVEWNMVKNSIRVYARLKPEIDKISTLVNMNENLSWWLMNWLKDEKKNNDRFYLFYFLELSSSQTTTKTFRWRFFGYLSATKIHWIYW